MPRIGNDIYVDMRDIKAKMQMLGTVLSEKEINQLQTRVLRDTGKEVKDIASEEVPEEYYIRASTVRKDIKRMQMSNANSGHAQCCIPIEGERHIIGGKTIPAVGGSAGFISISHGKGGRQFRGKRYKIYARILQDKFSVLPEEMTDQGGRPPFRNLTADKLHGGVYTRIEDAGLPPKPRNLPIARVAGLAVPQMVLNRASDDIQERIHDRATEAVESEFRKIMQKCRRSK